MAVSSLKDSSSGVNWIDHKVVSQSSALSRVYALSEIFTTLTTAGLTGWQSAFKRRLQRWLTLSYCTDRSRRDRVLAMGTMGNDANLENWVLFSEAERYAAGAALLEPTVIQKTWYRCRLQLARISTS